ncbi:UDP-glucose 4-epimerase GalE [Myroides sp. C15-4]|uniref:UDP-glucose 4-epimerase GalE n=1 Tax=Myroides sp. C15-4 TaxID=3400532 RepID=UPI003D2F6A73
MILVTGGLGFIGSHTVVELQQQGHEVLIVDDLSNASLSVLDGITAITKSRPKFLQLDLKDKCGVAQMFSKYPEIKGIIHFAASKAVGESMEKPLQYYENNIVPLINLLYELGKKEKSCLIFSSSCTVYGQAMEMPITEEAPVQKALSPYGNTKQMGEDIITDFAKVSTMDAILLRYFNPIGAHETAYIGELPNGVPQNLIPYITQTAVGKRKELSVFGQDYQTPDGTCIRDYIHVVDLAKAHVKALERLLLKKNIEKVECFNIGTGKGTSVLEIIKTFEKTTGVVLNYKIVERREGDVMEAYASTTKANKMLGWKAELSLEEALNSAWMWEKSLNK